MKPEDLEPVDLLTSLVMGEAEAEPILGKIAVAWVVKNRLADKRWPNEWNATMLQKYQFSCFLPGYFRPEILKAHWESVHWRECKYAAFGVFSGYVRDPVDGANHYHAKWILESPEFMKKEKLPAWARDQKPVAEIGQHLFYRL